MGAAGLGVWQNLSSMWLWDGELERRDLAISWQGRMLGEPVVISASLGASSQPCPAPGRVPLPSKNPTSQQAPALGPLLSQLPVEPCGGAGCLCLHPAGVARRMQPLPSLFLLLRAAITALSPVSELQPPLFPPKQHQLRAKDQALPPLLCAGVPAALT